MSGSSLETEEKLVKQRIQQVLEKAEGNRIPVNSFWNDYKRTFSDLPDHNKHNLPKRSSFFDKFSDVVKICGSGPNRCVQLIRATANTGAVGRGLHSKSKEIPGLKSKILPQSPVWASPVKKEKVPAALKPKAESINKKSSTYYKNPKDPELLGTSSSEEDLEGLPDGFMAAHPGAGDGRRGESNYHPYAQTSAQQPGMQAGNFYSQFAQRNRQHAQQQAMITPQLGGFMMEGQSAVGSYSNDFPLPNQIGSESRSQQRQRQHEQEVESTRRREDNYPRLDNRDNRRDRYDRAPVERGYGYSNSRGSGGGGSGRYGGGHHNHNQSHQRQPVMEVSKEQLNEVAKDCIDRLSDAKEYVSSERIEKLIIQHYSSGHVESIQDLGLRRIEEINAVNDHIRKQCKVNAYITAFVKVRPIVTLHELGESLEEFANDNQDFDTLKLGPVQKLPLIYEYFKFPVENEVPDISTWDVIEMLRDYLSKNDLWKSRELNMPEFMMYIKEAKDCESPYDTGVKIKSLPLAVQVLKRAQRDSSQNIKSVISQQKESLQDDIMAAFRHFGSSMLNKQVGYCEVKKEYLSKTALEVILSFSEKMLLFYRQLNTWSEITRNERKMINKMLELQSQLTGLCSMNKSVEAMFRLAICCGKEEIHQELWSILGKQFGGRQGSDGVIVLDDDEEEDEEGASAVKVQAKKQKPPRDDILKLLLKYLERCLASGALSLDLLVKIETKLLDEFNFPHFAAMGHGSFLECMTQHDSIKKFLEECGGSFLGGSHRGAAATESLYHATQHDVQDFVRQCAITDPGQISSMEQALCHHYQVKEVKSLGQGTSKHLLDMANKPQRGIKDPSVFYEGAMCAKNKGLSAVGDRRVGVLGHQTKEKALACLQNCPLLEDLAEWSHWDLVFQPELGGLKEFVQKYGRVHNVTVNVENGEKATMTTHILALENKPGTLLKLTSDTTAEKFSAAAVAGDVSNTCGHLVSMLVTNKGLDNLPTALLGNHMKTALLKMQAHYGMDEVPGGPSSGTQCSKVCEFVVDCFAMLPFQVCQAVANKIFLEPLAHVIGSTKSKDQLLMAARTSSQTNRLQILGCALGINEWSKSFEKRLVFPRDCLQRVEKFEDGMGGVIEDIIESEEENSDVEEINDDNGTITLSDDDDDDDIINVDESIKIEVKNEVEDIELSEAEASVEAMTIESESSENLKDDEMKENAELSEEIKEDNEQGVDVIGDTKVSAEDEEEDVTENIDPCKVVIDQIRREEFGIDVELSEDGKKLMLKQQERLGRSLDRLSKDLYSKDTHFVLELIQNADDNDYPNEMLSNGFDTYPSVEFLVEEDCITVYNNECGFLEKNVRAVCDVGRSTKGKHKFGYIGQKGIGFKSVFRVTDRPEIHSNGYHICFDVHSGPTGYILPHWIGREEATDNSGEGEGQEEKMEQEGNSKGEEGWTTRIMLPLKDDVRSKHQTRSLAARFHDVHPSLLLFLHRLRNLTVINIVEDYKLNITRRDLANNIIQIEHTGGTDSWLVVKKMLDASKISIQAKSGVEVESSEIALAFQLQTKDERLTQVLPPKQPVFAFLPLRSYGFRFVIQGDFDVPSSREDVDRDSMWNQWITGEIHKLFVEALETFKSQPNLNEVDAVCSFLQFVPMDDEILDFFKPVSSSILQQLRARSCLPTQPTKTKGIQWKMPSQLVVNKDSLVREVVSSELLQEHLNLDYLHQDVVHALNPSLSHSLGVQTLTTAHLMDIGKVFVDKLGAMDTDVLAVDRLADLQRLSKWLTCVYRSMDDLQPDQEVLSQLKQLPIIALTDGQMISLNEKTVFFPLMEERKQAKSKLNMTFKYIAADINTVDSQLFSKLDDVSNSQVHRLLEMLGVKLLSPKDVIHHHIMPVLKSDAWKTKPRDILSAYVMYIKDQLDQDPHILNLEELRSHVVVLTNQGIKRPIDEPVHFTMAYMNRINLEQFLPGYKWVLLDAQYMKGVTTEHEILKWRHFFVKLGVIDFLALKCEVNTVKWEDLDRSPWSHHKEFLPKMDEYEITDYECEEFMSLVAENKQEATLYNQMKHLFQCMDHDWDSIYKQHVNAIIRSSEGAQLKVVESSFAMLLKEVGWLPAAVVKETGVVGELMLGTEVYVRNPNIERLLSYHVPYLDAPINPQSSFCSYLGVHHSIKIEEVKDLLVEWCTPEEDSTQPKQFKTSFGHIKSVYDFLQENVPPKVLHDLLHEHPVIFYTNCISQSPNDLFVGQFLSRDRVRWCDPSGLFDKYKEVIKTFDFQRTCKKAISRLYPEPGFKDFFVKLGLIQKHPDLEEYSKLLIELCAILKVEEALPDVLKIFTIIGTKVLEAKSANPIESSIMAGNLEKVKILLKDERIIPVKGSKWVYLKDAPMIADDRDKEKMWKGKPGVHFVDSGEIDKRNKNQALNVAGVEQDKVAAFLEYIGIKKLSKSVSKETITESYKPCPQLQLYVHKVVPCIQMRMCDQYSEVHDALVADNIKSTLACMQFAQVAKLELVHRLETHPDVHPVVVNGKCLVSDNKEFFVHMDSVEAYGDINKELAKYFSNGDQLCFREIKNLLLEMMPFVTDDNRDLERFLQQNELVELPEGEEPWEVPAPLNWPPKPPTPPPMMPPPFMMEPVYEIPGGGGEVMVDSTSEQSSQKSTGLKMWPPPERTRSNEYRPPQAGDKPRTSVWPPPAPPEYMDHTSLPEGLRPSTMQPYRRDTDSQQGDSVAGGNRPPSRAQSVNEDGSVRSSAHHPHSPHYQHGTTSDGREGHRPHQHPLVLIPAQPDGSKPKAESNDKAVQQGVPPPEVESYNTNSEAESFVTAREDTTGETIDADGMEVQSPVDSSTPEAGHQGRPGTQGPQPANPNFSRSQSQIEMEYITSEGGQNMVNVDENWVKGADGAAGHRQVDRIPMKRQRTESNTEDSFHSGPRKPVVFYGNPVWTEAANESVYESLADSKDIPIPDDIEIGNSEAPPEIGKWGEKLVNSYLQQLKQEEDSDICEAIWVNEDQETGLPYDFVLKVQDPQAKEMAEIFIEVKSTLSDKKAFFEISSQEFKFAQRWQENFHIYRVFNAGDQHNVRLTKLVNLAHLLDKNHIKLCMVV